MTLHKTQYLYEAWSTEGFMMNSDEISKNAILLNANEPKNNRIATQISVLLYPMKETNEILILLAIYEAFVEISQIY